MRSWRWQNFIRWRKLKLMRELTTAPRMIWSDGMSTCVSGGRGEGNSQSQRMRNQSRTAAPVVVSKVR